MNATDRKKVALLLGKLEETSAIVEDIGSQLRELADAEQEKFDNMSEGLQQGERGQAIEAAASHLSDAADYCEAADDLGRAIEALGELGE